MGLQKQQTDVQLKEVLSKKTQSSSKLSSAEAKPAELKTQLKEVPCK